MNFGVFAFQRVDNEGQQQGELKMLKLYVSEDGKNFKEIAGLAVGHHLKPIKKVSVENAIKQYLKNCTAHKCEKNQGSEKLYFDKFKKFLAKNEINSMEEVVRIHIEEFEASLIKKMRVSSVNRRFNTFKHFFVKCKEWDFIWENPCLGMRKRKEENRPHKPWPTDIFCEFILHTTGVHTDLFYFLWLTGCRPMEAKNLRWTDIDYENRLITLRCGKNSQIIRQFPLTDDVSKLLHQVKVDSLYIFSDHGQQINNDSLYYYCKDRMKRITTDKYTVYGIRHAFGSRLSEAGANAFHIAFLMGHTNIETTKRYIHNTKDNLVKFLKKVA